MKLSREARALYRKLNERRRLIARWRQSTAGRNDTLAVAILDRRLIRLNHICDRATARVFRREDKGV